MEPRILDSKKKKGAGGLLHNIETISSFSCCSIWLVSALLYLIGNKAHRTAMLELEKVPDIRKHKIGVLPLFSLAVQAIAMLLMSRTMSSYNRALKVLAAKHPGH